MLIKPRLVVWSVLICVPPTLFAQDAPKQDAGQAKPEVLAGHSMHGDAFNEGPRQAAHLMGGTGKVNFPITSKVSDAQAFFNQGVGQLHGFWYFEAERSFRQVAALDPDCAMAYWGMCKANVNNQTRAKKFIEKAVEKKGTASRREQLWIDAYADLFKDDKKDDKTKRGELVRKLEDIFHEFPDDIEARAALAFHIWDNYGRGHPISSYAAVEAIINDVLAVEPMHPVHHFMIHLWDGDRAKNAVKSAARCGQSGPSIAHLWHMSGHTFTKLQRYADAAWQQEASARVDHAHMMRDRVLPDQIHNYAHNNQWCVESLEFIGRVHDAVELAKNLIELPRHPKFNMFNGKDDGGGGYDRTFGSSSEGRRRLIETLTRYELWDELIALADTMYLEATDIHAEQIKRLRHLGIALFMKNDTAKGDQQIAALDERLKQLQKERSEAAATAEEKARKENLADDKVATAMSAAMKPFSDKIKPIEPALAELRGYLALSRGEKDEATKQFDAAKDIPKERLARAWLAAGDKEKAEKLIRETGGNGSKQVFLAANFIDVLWQCGKEQEAKDAFTKLRELSGFIDLDVPVMRRLAPVASALELPGDWRVPAVVAADAGDRPNLADLGPFRWQPSPAADWSLPDSTGKTISLRDYHGKPVVVIFYLGAGCPHCIEQINVFKPAAADFAAAGISIVAISTDTVEGLNATFEKTKLGPEFPLVSDAELKAFKAYRAFDDFEKKPLHGTFLIDGDGLVRWQDISFEPFRDAKFLLVESKRQLSLKNVRRDATISAAK